MQQVKEHRRVLTKCLKSAAAEHALTTNHAIDWDHATVIDHHPHTSQCCLLESWHIVSQPESLNREVGHLLDVHRALLPQPRRQKIDNVMYPHTPDNTNAIDYLIITQAHIQL